MHYPYCDVGDPGYVQWINVAFLAVAGILVAGSLLSQVANAAPYGKHYTKEQGKKWGKNRWSPRKRQNGLGRPLPCLSDT